MVTDALGFGIRWTSGRHALAGAFSRKYFDSLGLDAIGGIDLSCWMAAKRLVLSRASRADGGPRVVVGCDSGLLLRASREICSGQGARASDSGPIDRGGGRAISNGRPRGGL